MIAIQQRFSQIDVKRNQQETKKGAKKGKKPLLDLHNGIKIITSSDETFDLWKELIIKYSQGELLDVDATPICKMRLNLKWTPHRDGILSHEFFKWLGKCDEEDPTHPQAVWGEPGPQGCSRIAIVRRSGWSGERGRSSSGGS